VGSPPSHTAPSHKNGASHPLPLLPRRFDPRCSGEVNYREVVARCKSIPPSDPEDQSADKDEWSDRVEQAVRLAFSDLVSSGKAPTLLAVFKDADTDGSGTLSPAEFQAALSRAGLPLRTSEVRRIIRKFDKDGDGRVNWGEFLEFVHVGRDVAERDRRSGAGNGGRGSSDGGGSGGGSFGSEPRVGSPTQLAGLPGPVVVGSSRLGSPSVTAPAVPSDAIVSSKLCRELLMLRLVHLPRLTAALAEGAPTTGGSGSVALSAQGSGEAVSYLRSRFTVVDRVHSGVVSVDDVAGE
jgi:Ca2+-binding EF-hand superfamily protein